MEPRITCRELISFLDDYVEEVLPRAERERFEWHLQRCASCRAYLDSYRRTISVARLALAAPPDTIPEDLVRAVVAAVGEPD